MLSMNYIVCWAQAHFENKSRSYFLFQEKQEVHSHLWQQLWDGANDIVMIACHEY